MTMSVYTNGRMQDVDGRSNMIWQHCSDRFDKRFPSLRSSLHDACVEATNLATKLSTTDKELGLQRNQAWNQQRSVII